MMSPITGSDTMIALQEVNRKLDTLITSLPSTYVTQSAYQQRISALESDFKSWQIQYMEDLRRSNDTHDAIGQQIQESERRILDKLDANNSTSWATKITLIFGAFGWIISIGTVIITQVWPK